MLLKNNELTASLPMNTKRVVYHVATAVGKLVTGALERFSRQKPKRKSPSPYWHAIEISMPPEDESP